MSNYILADDLSGALETGAAFRARGWRVTLPLTSGAAQHSGPGELEIVCTETRNEPPERAGACVREVVATRKSSGANLLFKKIDSTLRGPIAAELAAVVAELNPPFVVVCPANPAAGRVVREGVLYVAGVPLAESAFRNDPQWPAKSSRVGGVVVSRALPVPGLLSLESLRSGRVGAQLSAAREAGNRVLIADAEREADLRTIVASVREAEPKSLFFGSGAFAAALAGSLPPGGRSPPLAGWDECRPVLILCGSAHPKSHEQLAHLAEHSNVSVVTFTEGETSETQAAAGVAALLRSRGVVAVRFSSPGGTSPDSARRLQKLIGCWTRSLLGIVPLNGIVLTGGETAGTVCRELQGTQLEVITELEPGVVLSRLSRSGVGTLLVATKPGGFGSKEALSAVLPAAVK